MTPTRKKRILRKRLHVLNKRKRLLKRAERKRRRRVLRLRLNQRLKLGIALYREQRASKRLERKKKRIARAETAKLNRTLKRRRKR